MNRQPEISVVVPTHKRRARLAFALDALAAQTLPRDRYEVIVVASEQEADALKAVAPVGLAVSFLSSPVASAAAQRNVGWRSARAPLVAFTDDDCRPHPRWLESLLAAAAGPGVWLQGITVPDAAEAHLLRGHARSMAVRTLDPWAPTCNIAYPRALLERLGGFDESFPGAWGEDTDLALRARELGARPAFVPEACVEHAVHPRTLFTAVREGLRRNTIPAVIARHPTHRRALPGGVFVSPTHAWVLPLIAASLTAGPRRRLTRAAWLAYLVGSWDPDARPTPARVVRFAFVFAPRRAVLDVAEMLALAVGSARHRALVL